jgi:hypothetical protein
MPKIWILRNMGGPKSKSKPIKNPASEAEAGFPFESQELNEI